MSIIGGVRIGDGAVIGAGATVLSDIPPFAIAVGTPAKVIKYRFDEDMRNQLLDLAWWDWEREKIRRNAALLRVPIDDRVLRELWSCR